MIDRRAAVALAAVLLTACTMSFTGGSTASTTNATTKPSPSATTTPIPSPTMINGRIVVSSLDQNGAAVVAGILYPPSGAACGSGSGRYDACPVTDGLAQRLDANPLKQAEPLCRCQNTWQSRTIDTEPLPAGNPGAIAHVVLNFGSSTVKLDVTVLRTEGGWFASDTSCTGQDPSATSIYSTTPPPCS
jgi:hypothetical protein